MTIERKAQAYAQSFFFSFTPDNWTYKQLIQWLRKHGNDCYLDVDTTEMEDFAVWEPFETYRLSWVADQMDMMVAQLQETFK